MISQILKLQHKKKKEAALMRQPLILFEVSIVCVATFQRRRLENVSCGGGGVISKKRFRQLADKCRSNDALRFLSAL